MGFRQWRTVWKKNCLKSENCFHNHTNIETRVTLKGIPHSNAEYKIHSSGISGPFYLCLAHVPGRNFFSLRLSSEGIAMYTLWKKKYFLHADSFWECSHNYLQSSLWSWAHPCRDENNTVWLWRWIAEHEERSGYKGETLQAISGVKVLQVSHTLKQVSKGSSFDHSKQQTHF